MIADCRMISWPLPRGPKPPPNAQFALRGRRGGLGGEAACLLAGGGKQHEDRLLSAAASVAPLCC